MKISLNWLKDFVDFDLSPEELAATLTALGLEAMVESRPYDFQGVVVGRITSIHSVKGTEHLTSCVVETGTEILEIVCGAPNVKKGALVPVARIGATLPGGKKVKEAKIRGQVSSGMICAEDELGLSDDHSGIIILDKQATLGQDLK
ncbi:MAG: phenylalanine--tRNA ligase subunit beta, partial [Candidatus Neomarinimicrobiota bacterium]